MSAQSAEQSNVSEEKKSLRSEEVEGSYGALTDREKEFTLATGLADQYDIEALSSWKVFSFWEGTVISEKNLWNETGVLALVFWALFLCAYTFRSKGYAEAIGKEAAIRAFIAMFSTLIGLLLSFYTALSMGRWWQMRLGVENIQDACKNLTIMVSQGVTDDAVLIQAIQRYARASLYLIFAASQNKSGEEAPLVKVMQIGLLTQEEVDKLQKLNPHCPFVQAETLWVWLANVMSRLQKQGLTAGAPHYCALMGAVEKGRSGVSHIQTYLETPIPLGYVHLLCLMVKLHNFLLTILLSLTSVMLAGDETHGTQYVGVFRTAFRAFFMPFLYNSLLILNATVTNPFGADADDFDWANYDVNMSMNAKSCAMASEHLPAWVKAEKFKPMTHSQV